MSKPEPYNLKKDDDQKRLVREMVGYLKISRYWGMRVSPYVYSSLSRMKSMGKPMTDGMAVRLAPLVTQKRFLTDGTDEEGRKYAMQAIEEMAKTCVEVKYV